MTAPNHALTGAVIGLTITNPWLALPLAFLSHFVCDAIPHYDNAEENKAKRIGANRFIYEYILIPGIICAVIVLLLIIAQPKNWLLSAFCAFIAVSPDMFWIPRYITVRKTGKDALLTNPFLSFHDKIQWKTGPRLIIVEAFWFGLFGSLFLTYL